MISTIQGVEHPHGPIVDKCKEGKEPCGRIVKNENVCKAYLYPEKMWRLGNCPLATHIVETIDDSKKTKVRVGQQKQRRH